MTSVLFYNHVVFYNTFFFFTQHKCVCLLENKSLFFLEELLCKGIFRGSLALKSWKTNTKSSNVIFNFICLFVVILFFIFFIISYI